MEASNLGFIPQGLSLGGQVDEEVIDDVLNFIPTQEKVVQYGPNGDPIRNSVLFGWDFDKLEKGVYQYKELPNCIKKVRDAALALLNDHLEDNFDGKYFDNVIINIYQPGDTIIPHFDVDKASKLAKKRKFEFGEIIMGIILKVDDSRGLSFYHHTGEGRPDIDMFDGQLKEEKGLCFLMQGEARHAPVYHAVPTGKQERISITFRRTLLDEVPERDKLLHIKSETP